LNITGVAELMFQMIIELQRSKRMGDLDEVMNISKFTNIVQTMVLSYRELVLKKAVLFRKSLVNSILFSSHLTETILTSSFCSVVNAAISPHTLGKPS
jgi:hypothetical protein